MTPFRTFAAFLLVLAGAAVARAEVIVVNSTADLPDADLNDGVCDADLATAGLQCTLRAAIQHAATVPGADEIQLPPGRYRLTRKGVGEDQADTGDLDVRSDLTIVGTGLAFGVVIDAKPLKDRVFHVVGASLVIRNVTIRGGNAVDGRGGGVLSELAGALRMESCIVTKCTSADDGAGLTLNSGENTILDTSIVRNKSKDDSGAIDLGSSATLVVERCLFARNRCKDQGGAIENSSGTLTIRNSTLTGNGAVDGGGAIAAEDGSVTTLEHVTMAFNRSKKSSGGIFAEIPVDGGSNVFNIQNSIVHRNGRVNANAPLTTLGGNVESGDTCGFGVGDLVNTDAKLLPLAANGGQTLSHSLAPGSPARDFVTNACATTDQLGTSRGGAPCDAGAVESDAL